MASDERLDALEQQVAALTEEVRALRAASQSAAESRGPSADEAMRERLRRPPPAARTSASTEWIRSHAPVSGDALESLVGRYATLALAALVILMAVGAVIKMAVERGLLTPEVRILGGMIVAVALTIAGVWFRARGDVRYGGVLLAVALAVVDLVAWGAGPRFHLVPQPVALSVVDIAAILLASLALHDDSEFLFCTAVAGALSAPFVTADREGAVLALLSYGGVVIAGATRAARNAAWYRAFAVIVLGALVYALAAASLPLRPEWFGPFLIVLFCSACAAVALAAGEPAWRGELPRALLAVGVVGTLVAFDEVARRPIAITLAVALGVALLTQAALYVRDVPARAWRASALLLPLVSLGIAASATSGARQALVIAAWCVIGLAAWQLERRNGDTYRSATHLLSAGLLGSVAVTSWLWGTPLMFVVGLAVWGVLQSWLGRDEESPLSIAGVLVSLGAVCLSAVDQLASRNAFGYTPFATRSSASAAVAAAGLAVAGEVLRSGSGRTARLASRGARLGALIGFLIVWGRMEVAQAYSRDVSAFLLTSYYAACGVGSIVVGRRVQIGKLRVAGLCLAIYAALKAVVQVTDIESLALRVGAYAAVGVFLLGAGYLYREQRVAADEILA